jgi:uncharacterized membrane protein YphA (DoxX/SURF4 family)
MALSKKVVWTGRVISLLIALLFLMSASMKLAGASMATEEMTRLGVPESLIMPLGIVELSCALIYLLPPTAVLGAVLLTGYTGGAICTHLRAEDPCYVQAGLGLLIWLGIYLREDRLRTLLPFRRGGDPLYRQPGANPAPVQPGSLA